MGWESNPEGLEEIQITLEVKCIGKCHKKMRRVRSQHPRGRRMELSRVSYHLEGLANILEEGGWS
jgi:hypothetical protein